MSEMILTPVMTSDNTPSGQCSASSNFPNGYEPYKAFTQAIDTTSMWHATGPAPQWIQYKFDTSKCVNKIAVRNTTNAEPRSIKKFILQASNDGSTWTNLGECNVQNNSDLQYFDINNSNKYEYYRLNITEGYDNAYIGLNRIDLIYADDGKALVPAMTSVNTPEGECILYATGGSPAGDAPFYRVFDGTPSTIGGWANNDVNGTGTKDAYIGYHFTKPVKCVYSEFRWGGKNDSRYIFGVKLQGSNDGTNWVDLSEPVNIQMKTDPTVIESTKPNTYFTYLCIRYVSYSMISNIGYPQANEIQFYGTDDPPHLKSSGSTEAIRDWLNASLYNKEEIDNLFIQNNQQGLIPYDLTVKGYKPEQMVKLVGQTSGKVYNLCLAALMGGLMINFSTEEQKTGMKWIDGKDVYQKTIVGDTAPTPGQTHITGVDELICSFGAQLYTGGSPLRWYDFPFTGTGNGPRAEVDITTHNLNVIWGSGVNFTKYRWTFLYTKV